MKKEPDRSNQQTAEHGAIAAMQYALGTLLNMQPEEVREAFKEAYRRNLETHAEATLDLTVTDAYRDGVQTAGRKLLRLIR